MKRNKYFVALLGLFLAVILSYQYDIKAATIQVNNFASLKSSIESAPLGSTTVEITADFDVTGVVNIPTGVDIILQSDTTQKTIKRSASYTGQFFNMVSANSSLSITNLIIDGNKGNVQASASGQLFHMNNATTSLTIGNDVEVKNAKKINNHGTVIWLSNGSLIIEGNAIMHGNETQDGIIYANGANTTTIVRGNAEFYDNHAVVNFNTTSANAAFMVNHGTTTITDNVKIHDNTCYEGVGVIWNHSSGSMVISKDVEIYNNYSEFMYGAILNNNYLLIKDNVKIYHNEAATHGGAIAAYYIAAPTFGVVTTIIKDNVEIFDNISGTNGAALWFNAQSVSSITGNVKIYNNTAGTYAGGIQVSSSAALDISGFVKIYNNQAMGGAGIYTNGILNIFENVEIFNNRALGDSATAYSHGAGIRIAGANAVVKIRDKVKIYNNETTDDISSDINGGGIYITATVEKPVEILDDVQITNNKAVGDGGGIFTQEYEDLIVGENVIFSDNIASIGYNENLPIIDPTNYAIYQTNVLVPNNKWTTNRTYGYNNYDINYAGEHEAFILSYDANGGSGTIPSDQAIAGGDNVNVDFSKLPSKDGYVFLGWSTNANDTSPMYTSTGANTLMMPSNNLTLCAIYAPTFLIDTDVVDGDIDKPVVVINGDNIRIHFKGHKGYKLKKIIIDGKEIDISTITGDYYEILNVTNKHSIKVIFEKEEKDDNKEIKTGKDNKDNKKIPPGGNENLSYLGILLSVIVLGSSLYYQKKVIINKN